MSAEGNKAKVWITATDKRKDLSDAERYGELRDVFPPVNKNYESRKLITYARSVLSKSLPGDYLLLIGDPTLSCICASIMVEMHGKVNMLRWDRADFKYVPLELDFDIGQ